MYEIMTNKSIRKETKSILFMHLFITVKPFVQTMPERPSE